MSLNPKQQALHVVVSCGSSRRHGWGQVEGWCASLHTAHSPTITILVHCPLQVGTVYSSDNVWANIQASGHPWDISWHLGDASTWKPFFGPVLPLRELASIQVRVYSVSASCCTDDHTGQPGCASTSAPTDCNIEGCAAGSRPSATLRGLCCSAVAAGAPQLHRP